MTTLSDKNTRAAHCCRRCRLSQEIVCGIVRNRSGVSSGELDYHIVIDRVNKDKANVIAELKFLLKRLEEE